MYLIIVPLPGQLFLKDNHTPLRNNDDGTSNDILGYVSSYFLCIWRKIRSRL